MDDPTRRCENDTGIETRLPGLPIPSGGPLFFDKGSTEFHSLSSPRSLIRLESRAACGRSSTWPIKIGLIHFACDGDARLAEHMRHLRLAQA